MLSAIVLHFMGRRDVTGHIVAAALIERLGRQVVVENRAGAGSVIGPEIAANTASDGHPPQSKSR